MEEQRTEDWLFLIEVFLHVKADSSISKDEGEKGGLILRTLSDWKRQKKTGIKRVYSQECWFTDQGMSTWLSEVLIHWTRFCHWLEQGALSWSCTPSSPIHSHWLLSFVPQGPAYEVKIVDFTLCKCFSSMANKWNSAYKGSLSYYIEVYYLCLGSSVSITTQVV